MEAQGELNNMEVVTLAVYRLGGALAPVDIEDVALEAFAIAPRKFSWLKHEEHIDLRAVQYAAKNACSSQHGLLRGSIKHGYMLSRAGLEWAEKIEGWPQASAQSRKMSLSDQAARERARLASTPAYRKFAAGDKDTITLMEFREFARVNDYFPRHILEQRLERIANTVQGDPELMAAWQYLKVRFIKE